MRGLQNQKWQLWQAEPMLPSQGSNILTSLVDQAQKEPCNACSPIGYATFWPGSILHCAGVIDCARKGQWKPGPFAFSRRSLIFLLIWDVLVSYWSQEDDCLFIPKPMTVLLHSLLEVTAVNGAIYWERWIITFCAYSELHTWGLPLF